MRLEHRSRVIQYSVSFFTVALAILIRALLDPVLGDTLQLMTLYGAVAISISFGRWQAATAAALVGYGITNYLFMPPRRAFTTSPGDLVGFAGYALSCGLIIYLGELTHRSRESLEEEASHRKRIDNERETLLKREQVLRANAEAASRIKDEFLATVSHELRTPLNAILGWSTMLARHNTESSAAKRAVTAIERNARAQAQLIEDLLDVSRIISGKLRLDIKPIVLTPVIHAAVDSVRHAAEAKNIRIEIEIDSLATHLRADEARLQQVVWNLLSNSIKFTPRQGLVKVRGTRIDSLAVISVTDTGMGIQKEFLPFVFDRFQQADASTTRRSGGLGLGLSIARHIVEMHGGTIGAESDGEGRGSTFTICLPLAAVTQLPQTSTGAGSPANATSANAGIVYAEGPNLTGLRVLAVDDAEDTRDLIKVVLEGSGATVRTVGSARQALDVVSQWKPDIVICDIGMPEEDGFAFVSTMRTLNASDGGMTPAIALTGYVRVEDRMRALAAGYQMFVPKPVEALELASIIAAVVGRNSAEPQSARAIL